MLLLACQEAIIDGFDPQEDPAVALIAGRIGFASAATDAGSDVWNKMVQVCMSGATARLKLDKSAIQ